MTEPTIIFETNQQVARKVHEYQERLGPSARRYTLRPYQYQDPRDSAWWLIPSTDWPAYHHSKLCFHKCQSNTELLVGFYVEHGYSQEQSGEAHHSEIMKPDWYWFRFLRHAQNGDLDTAVRDVLERSQCPVILWMDACAPGQGRLEQIEFAIHTPALQFDLEEPPGDILSPLRGCSDLRDLAQRLLELGNNLQWYWHNLVLGVRLRYGNLQTGTWRAGDIWEKVLEPWERWIA